jgi:hypothetical protein
MAAGNSRKLSLKTLIRFKALWSRPFTVWSRLQDSRAGNSRSARRHTVHHRLTGPCALPAAQQGLPEH